MEEIKGRKMGEKQEAMLIMINNQGAITLTKRDG
jgi:hypothetical protein